MVRYDAIIQVGYKLRHSDIKKLTITQLFSTLRKATNVHHNKTLKHYVMILKDEGFIRFTNDGRWEVIDEGKQKQLQGARYEKEIFNINYADNNHTNNIGNINVFI